MASFFLQARSVAAMNVASLPDRLWPSVSTVVAFALTVLVLLGFLSVTTGIRATLAGGGREQVALVLQDGSPDESASMISRADLDLVGTAPQLARRGSDAVLSPERFVVVKGVRSGSGEEANLSLRGIGRFGLQVRPGARIVQGRSFTPGTDEMVVGRALSRTFEGLQLGRRVRLGGAEWRVVGVFEDGGSVGESEALVDIHSLQDVYGRTASYQSIHALLRTPADLAAFRRFLKSDTRLNLSAVSEREFLAKQAASVGIVFRALSWPLALAMAAGALVGALNTMYSSVSERRKEIATLRVIGFSPMAAFAGTLTEALALAVAGAAIGSLVAVLILTSLTASTMGANFTQMIFRFRLDGADFERAVVLSILVGLIGGMAPALRAARTPLTAIQDE